MTPMLALPSTAFEASVLAENSMKKKIKCDVFEENVDAVILNPIKVNRRNPCQSVMVPGCYLASIAMNFKIDIENATIDILNQ